MELNRLKITYPCMVAGKDCDVGDIIDCDDATAREILNCGRAEIANEATRARFNQRPRYTWTDPQAEVERRPQIHLVKAA